MAAHHCAWLLSQTCLSFKVWSEWYNNHCCIIVLKSSAIVGRLREDMLVQIIWLWRSTAILCRGAHMFFLRQGTVERWGGHIVNLIHYEDAAEFCLKVSAPILWQTPAKTDWQDDASVGLVPAVVESHWYLDNHIPLSVFISIMVLWTQFWALKTHFQGQSRTLPTFSANLIILLICLDMGKQHAHQETQVNAAMLLSMIFSLRRFWKEAQAIDASGVKSSLALTVLPSASRWSLNSHINLNRVHEWVHAVQ